MTDTATVLHEHLDALEALDLDALMEHYTDESVVVSGMGTFEGEAEIEALFAETIEAFPEPPISIDIHEEVVVDDYAFIEWTGETQEHVYEYAADSFHIEDGIIKFQSGAFVMEPKE